jgi:hypothetical protein
MIVLIQDIPEETVARPAGTVIASAASRPGEAPRSVAIDMQVAGGGTRTLAQFAERARQAGL